MKKVLHFLLYVAYSSRLEMSFLMDEFAMPPPSPDEVGLGITGLGSSPELSPTDPDRKPLQAPPGGSTSSDGQRSQAEEKVKVMKRSEEVATEKKVSMDVKSSSQGSNGGSPVIPQSETERSSVQETFIKEICQCEPELHEAMCPETVSMTTEPMATDSSANEVALKGDTKTRSKDSDRAQILDFSDPLQSYQKCQDDSVFVRSVRELREEKRQHGFKFRKVLDDVILSSSPYLKPDVPYLETESGARCRLREYFPKEVYWSSHFNSEASREKRKFTDPEIGATKRIRPQTVLIQEPHPFVLNTLTKPLSENSTQVRYILNE